MLALYKADSGYYRPVEIIYIDLVTDKVHFVFVRCYRFKFDSIDTIVPYSETIVDMQWDP